MRMPNPPRGRTNFRHVAGLLALSLCACTVGPDYRRPDIDIPANWRLGTTEAVEISNIAWWDQFQDEVLSDLMRIALENNRDVKVATARVDEAFAQYGIVRSAQFPQVEGSASATREGVTRNGSMSLRDGKHIFNSFGVNLSASFELDVWGKLRRATESAQA